MLNFSTHSQFIMNIIPKHKIFLTFKIHCSRNIMLYMIFLRRVIFFRFDRTKSDL